MWNNFLTMETSKAVEAKTHGDLGVCVDFKDLQFLKTDVTKEDCRDFVVTFKNCGEFGYFVGLNTGEYSKIEETFESDETVETLNKL